MSTRGNERSDGFQSDGGIRFVIGLFSFFCVTLLVVAWYASGLAPRMMERNYRTVKYAAEMQRALTAVYLAASSAHEPRGEDIFRFESNLQAEQRNITEPGEPEAVTLLAAQWAELRAAHETPTAESFDNLSRNLEKLSEMNEASMLAYEAQATAISNGVLFGGAIGFVLVLIYALQEWLQVAETSSRSTLRAMQIQV